MRSLLFISCFVFVAAQASASSLVSTGVFNGTQTDDFSTYADYKVAGGLTSLNVLGGEGTLTASCPEMWVINPMQGAGWGLGSYGSAKTYSGGQALGLFNGSPKPVTLKFTTDVTEFGMYFATLNPRTYGKLNLSFYGDSHNLLGCESLSTPSSSYVWAGWKDTSGIKSVEFQGDVAPVIGELRVQSVPEPTSIAALGIGCLGLIRRRNLRSK